MKIKTENLLFWIVIGIMILSLFIGKLSWVGIGFGYVIFAFFIMVTNSRINRKEFRLSEH
jgi:hypothetical protein